MTRKSEKIFNRGKQKGGSFSMHECLESRNFLEGDIPTFSFAFSILSQIESGSPPPWTNASTDAGKSYSASWALTEFILVFFCSLIALSYIINHAKDLSR